MSVARITPGPAFWAGQTFPTKKSREQDENGAGIDLPDQQRKSLVPLAGVALPRELANNRHL